MIRSKPDHSARGRAPLPVLYVASLLAMSLLVLPAPVARAANSVTVGSVTASPGETGVTIPIFLQNDVWLSGSSFPW
jgi:hypothetical protein